MRTVRDVSELLDATRGFTGNDRGGTIFRGQASRAWPLLPKAGRRNFADRDWRSSFDEWSRGATTAGPLPAHFWQRLALAHHYGLAGPLLDWTTSPLVAAYFAVTGTPYGRADGVVYRFDPVVDVDPNARDARAKRSDILSRSARSAERQPFPALVVPPFAERLRAQQAAFTYHSDCRLAMSDLEWPFEHVVAGSVRVESLEAFRIPARCKNEIARQLGKCGVTRERLFPDRCRGGARSRRDGPPRLGRSRSVRSAPKLFT